MLFADDHRTVLRRMTSIRWVIRVSALLLALAIIGVGWIGDAMLKRHLASLKRDHADAVALIKNRDSIHGHHTELQNQLATARNEYQSLLRRIPTTASEGGFLRELSLIAAECELTIRDFRPGRVSIHPTHSEKQIQLRAEGDHVSLCRFLAALQSTNRMSRVSHLTVGPAKKQDLTSAIDIHIEIAFEAKAQTTI